MPIAVSALINWISVLCVLCVFDVRPQWLGPSTDPSDVVVRMASKTGFAPCHRGSSVAFSKNTTFGCSENEDTNTSPRLCRLSLLTQTIGVEGQCRYPERLQKGVQPS